MAALILRTLTNAGDTTKGSPLTNAEVDTNFINLDADIALKADLASPTFTGTPAAPTATAGTSTTQIATTAFVGTAVSNGITTERSASVSISNKTITASTFSGDGSGLTNLDAGDIALGTLAIARGGTNGTATPTAGAVSYGTGTSYAFTAAGTSGQVLTSNGAGAPTWASPASGVTLSEDDGATVRYPVFASGTGSFSTGFVDITTTPLSYTPSTGTLTAAAFSGSGVSLTSLNAGNISSGLVPVVRGGTGTSANPVAGAVAFGTGTEYNFTAAGTAGQVLTSNGAGTPTWTTISGGATLADDTTTNASTYYPTLANNQTTGSMTAAVVSSTKLYYNPSSGTLNATAFSGSGAGLTSLNAASLTGIVPTANGGTANAFFTVSGPTTTAKTFIFPNSNATVLTSASAVTVGQGGTGLTSLTSGNVLLGAGTSNVTLVAPGSNGNVLTSNGSTWQSIAPAVTLAGNNVFTGANVYQNATGQTFLASATSSQDGIVVRGRAGGTGTFRVTVTPTTLNGNRSLALPDYDGTAVAVATTGTNGQVLTSSGSSTSAPTWTTISSGATVSNDTTTNANTYYPTMANNQTTGAMTSAVVSNTKLYFNPSTGTLNSTIFNSLSDITLKKDVTRISDGLEVVLSLNPVEFVWKDSGKKSAGVIAQEIEQILPHLVDTNEEGIKSVNYMGMIAYLVEAVKKLDARVRTLENRG